MIDPEDSTIYLHATLAAAIVATFLVPTAATVAFAFCIAVCVLVPVDLKMTHIAAVLLQCFTIRVCPTLGQIPFLVSSLQTAL